MPRRRRRFCRSRAGGKQKVQVEFVSANPTGPLHVGHGRGAAYGASLSSLLGFAGWDVTREYYVNDAGRQMDILGLSTWLRYLEPTVSRWPFRRTPTRATMCAPWPARCRRPTATSTCVRPPRCWLAPRSPDAGRADDEAKSQRELHLDALIANAKTLLGEDWAYVHNHALTEQLADGRDDLEQFGVHFEVWFSEKALFDTGPRCARCVEKLEAAGHIYEQDGANGSARRLRRREGSRRPARQRASTPTSPPTSPIT